MLLDWYKAWSLRLRISITITTNLTYSMPRSILATLAAALVLAIAPLQSQAQAPNAKTNVIEVKMIDISPTEFGFSPAKITVKQGDVVRFTQVKVNMHNVEFKGFPAGVNLGDLLMGPFMMTVDQVYEITIDKHFAPGTYDYVCMLHVSMGMKGQIIVTK